MSERGIHTGSSFGKDFGIGVPGVARPVVDERSLASLQERDAIDKMVAANHGEELASGEQARLWSAYRVIMHLKAHLESKRFVVSDKVRFESDENELVLKVIGKAVDEGSGDRVDMMEVHEALDDKPESLIDSNLSFRQTGRSVELIHKIDKD